MDGKEDCRQRACGSWGEGSTFARMEGGVKGAVPEKEHHGEHCLPKRGHVGLNRKELSELFWSGAAVITPRR